MLQVTTSEQFAASLIVEAIAYGLAGGRCDWHGSQAHWDWELVNSAMHAVHDSERRVKRG